MVWAYGAQSWGYGTNGLNELCPVPQSSSVETEGKWLLNLQGHCSPRKAVPLETVLYWEEQGAEEREGRGGAFIFSSWSESLLISDLKSSACVSVLVEVTWDSSSQRPFLQNTKGEESPSTFLSGNLQGEHDLKILPVPVPGSKRTVYSAAEEWMLWRCCPGHPPVIQSGSSAFHSVPSEQACWTQRNS